jgi:chromosome segregation protein
VYLKTLTLRGFKSFASATTLRFEPGITCVVGPNGSGKSNVVDALSWVMGEQGAKSLRGGKMEDVIFAGTSGRPPLGRAEVVLTIDNTDGALPIDYTEVTISRTMFRNGGSEYAINGEGCRLLDVQELLSDSGIGREMHVIVGQGQLDSVLSATPEDRRGFIEEAAGVLKHRKRKEKALRKLDAMEANLVRLNDLTAELRRQLKPLGRQAEVARRAGVVQAEVRDARLRILADDLCGFRLALEQEVADENALLKLRAEAEAALATSQQREIELEAAVAATLPALSDAQETWFRLNGLRDRFRGLATLAAERVRFAAEVPQHASGREPEDMEREAREIREQEAELEQRVLRDRAILTTAEERRAHAENELATEESRIASVLRAIADRREGMARLAGRVAAARTTVESAGAERDRLQVSLTDAQNRARTAQEEFTGLESQVAGLDRGEVDLDGEYEKASGALAQAQEQVAALREEERVAEQERAALVARVEALEIGLDRRDGSAALLAASDRVSGLLGSVATIVTIEPGAETAVATALGAAADAVAVSSVDSAVDALTLLKQDDAGRAGIVVGGGDQHGSGGWPTLPAYATYAVDLVQAPSQVRPALRRLLDKVAVVDGLNEARALLASEVSLIAVTRDGDLLGATFAQGGSSHAPSLLEVQAAVDEAKEQLVATTHRCERLRFALTQATANELAAQQQVDAALARLHESDAQLAAVAEQLGHLGSSARSAAAEAERLGAAIAAAVERHEEASRTLRELEQRLTAAEQQPEADDDPDTVRRNALAATLIGARETETEARLAVRTGEERARALHGRADQLDRAAESERLAREEARRLAERAARDAEVARAVLRACDIVSSRLDRSLALAAEARTAAENRRTVLEAELLGVRTRSREIGGELEQLTDSVHRDEVARTEQRLRIEQIEARAMEEYGVEVEALIAEYGPDQLVPPPPLAPDEEETDPPRQSVPYVRAEQEKRLKVAERNLALLGKVNPLALEEFSAMEERHQFLTEQLEDLKKTKRDLLEIIREVDERVEQVFTEAYHDVAAQFVEVFARLFPGGEGRLVLTDPSDMLATGVDIEARPPGKKVKRLSLLSGGERSLTAVAFLVALFKARPSPFYVLDEVEAALDDTNLGRLLDIYEELRENSQLIVITHQKRTMEVADALYGVSMRGDGVSAVISQRLREAESA